MGAPSTGILGTRCAAPPTPLSDPSARLDCRRIRVPRSRHPKRRTYDFARPFPDRCRAARRDRRRTGPDGQLHDRLLAATGGIVGSQSFSATSTDIGGFRFTSGQLGSETFSTTSYRIGDFTFTHGRVGSGTLTATRYTIGGSRQAFVATPSSHSARKESTAP
jgi:hypothetical protein